MKDIFELAKEKIVITAEIGINHNGDLKLAEEMIDAAAQCGVDAVKFQAFNTEFMYSRLTPGFSHTDKDVFAQMKALEINESWWQGLRERAKKRGLYFSSSIFDRPSLDILKKPGLDFVKIASAEIDNLEFLAEQIALGDIFVISTGMAYLEEIAAAVRCLREKGITKIILLECTSSYPAPPEAIHLLNIDFLRETFPLPVGFSDHTMGYHHAVAAAARGARFIEKHFTLDKNMPGPDHKISADAAEMKQLVHAVREIEISLKTNGKFVISPQEKDSRELGRKSVVALRKIAAGETISRENTIIKRPAKGIKPSEARHLYGRVAGVDIEKDQWITWNMVK
ncbi:MAG: N-acetylneuraminate synthase family protein [Candidatus Aminicenantes bacterium]|nr:N-acetylneuraminate synthase family protein [Candidatus Aminicenantes bacterium]